MSRRVRAVLFLVFALLASCGDGAATTTSASPATTSSMEGTTTSSTTTASTTTASTTTASTTTTTTLATTTTLVNANRLTGTWVAPNHAVYIMFDGEGTHFVSYLNGEPFDFGPYHLDGNVLTLVSGEGQEVCPDGSTGTYEIAIPTDPKELRAQLVSDNCSQRTSAMISAPLRWWSPLP